MWTYETCDELYHHGIKGQKWGVRRYQNPDGTLTEQGKNRLKNSFKKNSVKASVAALATPISREIGARIGADVGARRMRQYLDGSGIRLSHTPFTKGFELHLESGEWPASFTNIWMSKASGFITGTGLAMQTVGTLTPAAIATGAALAASYAGYKLISNKIKEKQKKE